MVLLFLSCIVPLSVPGAGPVILDSVALLIIQISVKRKFRDSEK